MTGKSAFTEEEWDLLREAPGNAGLMVVMAESGGSFRETYALAKGYAEARKQHGASEFLDELVAAGPKRGPRAHSSEQLHEQALDDLRNAAALLRTKGTQEDLDGYRAFVLALGERVAEAHKEGGQSVSDKERAALSEIETTLTG
jgi:hypothetical protein